MADESTQLREVQKLATQVARLEERAAAAERALKLQATENSRRFDELNHAARTRELRDNEFVSIDRHDGFYREFLVYREQVNKVLHELEGRTSGLSSARANLYQVIGVGLVVATIAISVVIAILKF